jgi:tRNA threonylcarbamoyladenosine biosynthesis protein TsaB
MRVLLIHTCSASMETGGVAALADESGLVANEALPGRGTSEALMPAVERLFAATGWVPRELTAVGVVHGPGSFTGVRVGLSAAKGLCDALGIGMVAISRLALLAGSAGEMARTVAVLDGGRGEFFCGVYDGPFCLSERLLTEAETRVALATGVGVACEAKVAERLGILLVAEPGAELMGKTVRRRIAVGDWSDVATVDANYLRRTDAEIKRATSVGGEGSRA